MKFHLLYIYFLLLLLANIILAIAGNCNLVQNNCQVLAMVTSKMSNLTLIIAIVMSFTVTKIT